MQHAQRERQTPQSASGLTRRHFLKCSVVLGAALSIPGGLASPGKSAAAPLSSLTSAKDRRNLERLNAFAAEMNRNKPHFIGYPANQDLELQGFYEWYRQSGLYETAMNNVGDPYRSSGMLLNAHAFEREVVDYFAPRFGFDGGHWGFVTASGTDGNSHGMYFGKKYLQSKSDKPPIVYVSEEAHYSIKKLADVQGMELRLIKADTMGRIDVRDFEARLDPARPALVVVALGTTFKGAIDDQVAMNGVLDRVKPPAVYRHQDAALFGSILGFMPAPASDLVNSGKMRFDSIAISGHKFWGMDEPCGVFVTTKEVRGSLNPFKVEYLRDAVPTISCSRNSIAPLKLWWKIAFSAPDVFERQAAQLIFNANYLHEALSRIGVRSWLNEYSNTVFFERPSEAVMDYYGLAPDVHPELGPLAHVIVMQHVGRKTIDVFVEAMRKDFKR